MKTLIMMNEKKSNLGSVFVPLMVTAIVGYFVYQVFSSGHVSEKVNILIIKYSTGIPVSIALMSAFVYGTSSFLKKMEKKR